MLDQNLINIVENPKINNYPENPPYNPSERYPEYPFVEISRESNEVYRQLRDILHQMKLDDDNYGTKNWNPLGKFIKPNETVIIKPNFVTHYNWGRRKGITDTDSLVTHGSIIRAVLDYVEIALKDKGRIIIGDAPLQSADFKKIVEITKLTEIKEFYETKGIKLEIVDFRLVETKIDNKHRYVNKKGKSGDRRGYIAVNIGPDSMLNEIRLEYKKFRVANYDPKEMQKHHNENRHEYIIPKIVFEADVIINLPKMKTHLKAGITGALKNLIGINGHKDWLPHHMKGAYEKGGDEYNKHSLIKALWINLDEKEWSLKNKYIKRIIRFIKKFPEKLVLHLDKNNDGFYQGGWYGNDTIWRTTLDLNRILFYTDKNGRMNNKINKKYLAILDGIIAGEGDGPLSPQPKSCGVIMGGINPVMMDLCSATYMGFDYKKIPTILNADKIGRFPLLKKSINDIQISINGSNYTLNDFAKSKYIKNFKPASGWIGNIEKC